LLGRRFCGGLLRSLLLFRLFDDRQLLLFHFDQIAGISAELLFFQRRYLRLVIEIVFFEIHSILPWGNRFHSRATGARKLQWRFVSYSGGKVKDSRAGGKFLCCHAAPGGKRTFWGAA